MPGYLSTKKSGLMISPSRSPGSDQQLQPNYALPSTYATKPSSEGSENIAHSDYSVNCPGLGKVIYFKRSTPGPPDALNTLLAGLACP